MRNIGLDFGTTNSIIAYYDDTKNSIEKFEQASSMDAYIPSFFAVSKEDGDISIGSDAKSKMGNEDYDVYSKFKMLLHEEDSVILEDFDWPENSDKKPAVIAEEYIRKLIETYCDENKVNISDIDNFTITVPEIWIKDGNHKGRETLLDICEKILNKKVKLISEPVAASAYYSYHFNKKFNKPFEGHLLVCDFGGGTLDISLSELKGTDVKILESSGAGKLTQESLGVAGVAYDDAVISNVYEENEYKWESIKEHHENIIEFEYKKIQQKETLDKMLPRYLKENSRNRAVFSIMKNECKPSHFCKTFDEKIKNVIIQKLDDISKTFSQHNIDTSNPDKFKVLLVGGFCNFYLVQNTVKEFFASEVSQDFRFDDSFIDADKNLAIAKGAAILSANLISIDTVVPLSVGIITFDENKNKIDKVYLKKGTPLEDSKNIDFLNSIPITLPNRDALKKSMKLFIDSENGHIPIELSPLSKYLPNPQYGNEWFIAFSMNENRCYHIHIKDKKEGKINNFNLGNLLEKVK